MNYRLLTILCLFSFSWAFAQKKNTVHGFIKDSISHDIIEFAGITNLNTAKTSMANVKGFFSIDAKDKHLLSFAAIGYNFDTLRITSQLLNADTIIVYLSPLTHKLQSVTVTTKASFNSYQLDSIERHKDFFQTMSEHTLPVASLSNSGSGIALNLDHFYGIDKQKRKAISLFYEMENQQYINYRFTPQIVTKYTSLTNDALSNFMQQYRPTYAWLRSHTSEEDLLYYINDKLKLFHHKR